MKNWKRFLALLLVLVLTLGILPAGAAAKMPETHEISAAAYQRADAIYEALYAGVDDETTSSAARAQSIYDTLLTLPGVVEDTVTWRGNSRITWETEDGVACAWSAYLEDLAANAEPVETDLPDEVFIDYSVNGTTHGKDTYLVQPYYGLDSSFTTQYQTEAKRVAQTTGGTYNYKKTTAATIDFVAEAISKGGVVFFDSHGDTDYTNRWDQDDHVTGAHTSYLLLQTGVGITSADMAYDSEADTYHALYGGSYGSMKYYEVDGTAIANHMTQNSSDGMLWAAICLGMATDGLHAPLMNKGLGVAYGYSQSVTFVGDYFYEETFFNNLCAGKTVAQSISVMKSTWGNWDWSKEIAEACGYTGDGYWTIEEAKQYYAAFPIVVSAQDTYPGHGNVDRLQSVYSTWTLLSTAPCSHTYGLVGAKDPTCTEEGYTGDTACTKCGDVKTQGQTIPALGHTYSLTGAKDPTCTENGYSGDTVCGRCGNVQTKGRSIPALGHSFQLVGAKDPTCTENGYTGDTVCQRQGCGYVGSRGHVLEKTGHSLTLVNQKNPTCTETGYTGDTACSVCGSVESTGSVIPALGHDYEVFSKMEPTCVMPGYTGDSICTRCHHEIPGQTIPAKGHSMAPCSVMEPTCTEGGYTLYQCADCGATEPRDPVSALGHTPGEWFVEQEARPHEPGAEIRVCTACGEVMDFKEIPGICPGAAFGDVNTGKWYHAAVDFVLERGIMKGSGEKFMPTKTMTRAELATIFHNLAGAPAPQGENPFSDVSEKFWGRNAIVWASENGIVQGSGGRFMPNDPVTREQVAVMLQRYAKGADGDPAALNSFTDAGSASKYARPALAWAVENGYLQGSAGKLNPKGTMTRAEVAQLLMNFLGE